MRNSPEYVFEALDFMATLPIRANHAAGYPGYTYARRIV